MSEFRAESLISSNLLFLSLFSLLLTLVDRPFLLQDGLSKSTPTPHPAMCVVCVPVTCACVYACIWRPGVHIPVSSLIILDFDY